MKAYSLFLVFVFLLVPIKWAKAEIGLGTVWGDASFNTLEIELGITSDEEFDFEVAICGLSNGNTNFNAPLPEGWEEIFTQKCLNNECQTGVWSRLAEHGSNVNIFSWSELAIATSCVILPFSKVDIESPIINYECSSGISTSPTAPAIMTEANSVVVRTFLLEGCASAHLLGNLGNFFNKQCGDIEFVFFGSISTKLEAGDTGTEVYTDNIEEAQWQACTIALRMQSMPPSNIPTLSEWGLIAMAGILGIVGFMVIRRRKVTA